MIVIVTSDDGSNDDSDSDKLTSYEYHLQSVQE